MNLHEIKHLSLDLWQTLIKSNPLFKKRRAELIFQKYNASNFGLSTIEDIIRKVDLLSNSMNEITGRSISSEEMYLMVLNETNGHINGLSLENVKELQDDVEQIFYEFHPILYDEHVTDVLNLIKRDYTLKFSISSNTAFIKGVQLRKVLKMLRIEHFFDFQIYSDEIGASKPSLDFFNTVYNNVNLLHKKAVLKEEILHVGDNSIADIEGGKNYGFKTFHVNSNSVPLKNILKKYV